MGGHDELFFFCYFQNFLLVFVFQHFIYLGLCWVFVAPLRLFLVAESWGYSLVVVLRLLIAVAFLLVVHGL